MVVTCHLRYSIVDRLDGSVETVVVKMFGAKNRSRLDVEEWKKKCQLSMRSRGILQQHFLLLLPKKKTQARSISFRHPGSLSHSISRSRFLSFSNLSWKRAFIR